MGVADGRRRVLGNTPEHSTHFVSRPDTGINTQFKLTVCPPVEFEPLRRILQGTEMTSNGAVMAGVMLFCQDMSCIGVCLPLGGRGLEGGENSFSGKSVCFKF
jgi:hypothetical protein